MKLLKIGQLRLGFVAVLIGASSAAMAQDSVPALSLWLESGGANTEVARYCAATDPMIIEWFNQYKRADADPRQRKFKARKATQYYRSMCSCGRDKRAVSGRKAPLDSEVRECALNDR